MGRLGRLGNAESQLEASTEKRCRPGLNWEKLGDSEESGRHSSLGCSLVQLVGHGAGRGADGGCRDIQKKGSMG